MFHKNPENLWPGSGLAMQTKSNRDFKKGKTPKTYSQQKDLDLLAAVIWDIKGKAWKCLTLQKNEVKNAAWRIFQQKILPSPSSFGWWSKLKEIIRCFGKYASLISGGKLLEKNKHLNWRLLGYSVHSDDMELFPDANDYKRCLISDMYINIVDYKYCITY